MVNTAKIVQLRKRLGLSQAEAARKAGMKNRQNWNKLECAEAGISTTSLERIAIVLGCRAKDLLK